MFLSNKIIKANVVTLAFYFGLKELKKTSNSHLYFFRER